MNHTSQTWRAVSRRTVTSSLSQPNSTSPCCCAPSLYQRARHSPLHPSSSSSSPVCSTRYLSSTCSLPAPRRGSTPRRRFLPHHHQLLTTTTTTTFPITTASPCSTTRSRPFALHRTMATTELPLRPAPTAEASSAADTPSPLPVDKLDAYPNCYPAVNPVDVYRSHLTTLLHDVTGVDKAIIYPALQWTQSSDKGDLILATPALRVKGKKPNELAEEWVSKVSFLDYELGLHGFSFLPFFSSLFLSFRDFYLANWKFFFSNTVPRVPPRQQARGCRPFHPVLVQGRTPHEAPPTHGAEARQQVRNKRRLWPQGP